MTALLWNFTQHHFCIGQIHEVGSCNGCSTVLQPEQYLNALKIVLLYECSAVMNFTKVQ